MKPKVDCHISYAVSGAPTAPGHCVHMDVSHLLSHLTCRVGIAMRRGEKKKNNKKICCKMKLEMFLIFIFLTKQSYCGHDWLKH